MHWADKEKKVRQKPGDRIGVLPGKIKKKYISVLAIFKNARHVIKEEKIFFLN